MAVHFIIDGYNIIKQTSLGDKKLEEGREAFIRLIETQRPQGSANNKVTVVFDGREGFVGLPQSSTVRIIFTSGETADEKIKSLVAQATNKKNIVVVTDDRDIRYSVRSQGAKICSVEEFLDKGQKVPMAHSRGNKASQGTLSHKNIPQHIESKINSELRKIWLK